MKHLFILFLCVCLFACSSTKESRYQDTANLERPPQTPAAREKNESHDNNKTADSEKDTLKGLNSGVYLIENGKTEIRIKRSYDEAWELLGQAIRLNEFKITGKNRKQGSYEISYKAAGLFGGFGLFGSGKPSKYLFTLDNQGNEIGVTVSKIEDDEVDPGRLMDGTPDYSYDSSSKLANLIYETLRQDVEY